MAGMAGVQPGLKRVRGSRAIFFRRFDAVDHPAENVWLRWTYEPSRPLTSLKELALIAAWKACYAFEGTVPRLRRARERSTLNVYIGAWLADSGLRSQIAALRNEAQYRTVGAGIDVGFAPLPGQEIGGWEVLSEWFKIPKTRLHMQMYLKVVSLTPLQNTRVLEVGCGQGDGAAFLSQALAPSKYVGVDLHPTQVGLCRQRFASLEPRLSFQRADAEHLPFANDSFDAVLNIESAHSYPRFEQFVAEVFRVLKPGGHFCFADLRKPTAAESCVQQFQRYFSRPGFTVVRHEDITQNAWQSIDELRNQSGGRLWDEFESLRKMLGSREFEYHWYVLAKVGQE
jgi:ubiquinone/menaquinone biosynthesis C-methylase UbiE